MADNANSGMAFLSIQGQGVRLASEFTWDCGKTDRETQKGMDGIHGQKLSPRVPFISMVIRDSAALSISSFNDIDDGSIFCQLISGKTVSGRGMYQVGPTEVNSEEGTVSVRFEGGTGSVREGLAAA
jgi:hypothetical protein